jgi:hypothetical protein
MSYLNSSEKASIRHRDINKIVNKAIVKEKASNARILYAGVNPNNSNTMIVCKVVELFRGKFFYEETIFNPRNKSVHTTISTCDKQFDRIIAPGKLYHQQTYQTQLQAVSATCYSRQMKDSPGSVFQSSTITDFNKKGFFWTSLREPFFYCRLGKYLNSKK